ncbi:hypothetical protein UGMREWDR_CDS0027 [Aeromonas phage GomatiRiver_11]|nr:hypothetical protein OBDJBBDK_00026 [Aeromonas phage AhFM11]WKW84194.1 hypothetical protein UGMREWDR_CDS0027 [Aeromonas phage GomatiRiver_11]
MTYEEWNEQNKAHLERWVAENVEVSVEIDNIGYSLSNDVKLKVYVSVGDTTISGYDTVSLSKE